MIPYTHEKQSRALRRAAIERIIAAYPEIDQAGQDYLLDYFRRHASARDRAAIAANRAIRPQYRQLLRDQKLDWLPWVDIAIVCAIGFLLVLGVIFLAFADFGGPA